MALSPKWVQQQLEKLPADRGLTFKGDHALIRCHSHANGAERNPSLTITLDKPGVAPGVFGCWACGVSGSFADLVAVYPKFLDAPSVNSKAKEEDNGVFIHPEIRQQESGQQDVELVDPDSLHPWPEAASWRKLDRKGRVLITIPGKTVLEYNGKMIERFGKHCLYFPVHIYEQYVGGIFAALDKQAGTKDLSYINTPGKWTGTSLFGFDQAMASKYRRQPCWIAEGPRSCAKLMQLGQRNVGLLGAANVKNPKKMALLMDLEPPYFLIATDPDEAGDTAAQFLKRSFTENGVKSIHVKLPADTDPSDLDKEQVRDVLTKANTMFKFGGGKRRRK